MTLQFGIGESRFSYLVREKCAIVDKTLFIRSVMSYKSKVQLFTRPRRFGKTLNMTMLQEFLSLEGPQVFEGFNIAQDKEFCLKHQNQYPVIFLSFKDCKGDSHEALYKAIEQVISDLYSQYAYILEGKILEHHKVLFKKAMQKQIGSPMILKRSLVNLTRDLSQYTGKKVIVLIDEDDTPIHSAYANGFYPQIIEFMRALLGSSLKDNDYLEKAVLTGITRVAKESMFSGLNNLAVYTILDDEFSSDFGFTEDEVRSLIPHDQPELMPSIRQWYNGYTFGSTQIYNPWSILNCLQRKGKLDLYWVNTSENLLLFKMIEKAPSALRVSFENLIMGIPQDVRVEDQVVLQYRENNASAIWTLLLHSGYLNVSVKGSRISLKKDVTLTIPNEEVRALYAGMVESWFSTPSCPEGTYTKFLDALAFGDVDVFASYVSKYTLETMSFFDLNAYTPERVFHVFMAGIVIGLFSTHTLLSNREIGLGRADLILIPKEPSCDKNTIIIEFKACKEPSQLESLAKEALLQIQTRQYAAPFSGPVIRIGMAFCGKEMRYQWEKV